MPPLSILFPMDRNMEEKFAVLKPGPEYDEEGYTTLARAKDDGAVVLAYGYVKVKRPESRIEPWTPGTCCRILR